MKRDTQNESQNVDVHEAVAEGETARKAIRGSPLLNTMTGYVTHYVQLAREHERALARAGWRPEKTAELHELLGKFFTALAARRGAAAQRALRQRIRALVSEVRTLRRRLAAAFQLLQQEGQIAEASRDASNAGKVSIGAPAAVAWLGRVRAELVRERARLRPMLPFDPVAVAERLLGALIAAMEERKDARLRGIAETRALRGALTAARRLVVTLRTAARNAFADDRATLALFRAPARLPKARTRPAPAATAAAEEAIKSDAAQRPAANDAPPRSAHGS